MRGPSLHSINVRNMIIEKLHIELCLPTWQSRNSWLTKPATYFVTTTEKNQSILILRHQESTCGMKFKFGFSFLRHQIKMYAIKQWTINWFSLRFQYTTYNEKEGELKKKEVFSEVKFYAIFIFENNVLFCSRILQEMHNPFDLLLKLSS